MADGGEGAMGGVSGGAWEVRGTGEAVSGWGAAFFRERGSCGGRCLATPIEWSTLQCGGQAEQGRQLRVPVQDAMDHAAALAHDLTGDL